jgi:GNAT superfamily N-acetyltransferase
MFSMAQTEARWLSGLAIRTEIRKNTFMTSTSILWWFKGYTLSSSAGQKRSSVRARNVIFRKARRTPGDLLRARARYTVLEENVFSDTNEHEYEISTDKERLDMDLIHDFLANQSYWAKDIPFEVMKKSIENAMCFGAYHQGKQVGFARVVTDYATIAYIGDVFIIETYRGRGLGKRLIKTIIDHPGLKGLRLWLLGTRDAHDLYRKFGFKKVTETPAVERFMTILNPETYKRGPSITSNQKTPC